MNFGRSSPLTRATCYYTSLAWQWFKPPSIYPMHTTATAGRNRPHHTSSPSPQICEFCESPSLNLQGEREPVTPLHGCSSLCKTPRDACSTGRRTHWLQSTTTFTFSWHDTLPPLPSALCQLRCTDRKSTEEVLYLPFLPSISLSSIQSVRALGE